MQLSPEERQKIYEEEKARIEAEKGQFKDEGGSSTGLDSNIAGLLCYIGAWISGIVFIIIEQKDRFVRFHALQSIITFGALSFFTAILGLIPYIGEFMRAVTGIFTFILWILLMVRAYQGKLYKVPVAGDIASGILSSSTYAEKPGAGEEKKTAEPSSEETTERPRQTPEITRPELADRMEQLGRRIENTFTSRRAGRIAGYSIAIFWNVVLILFFSFYNQYIAWYHVEPDGSVTRLSLLTGDYYTWLPIAITAMVISAGAYVLLIIYDRYWLKEIVEIILAVISIVVVVNLISIFPFDFSVITNATAADIVPVAVTVGLIVIAVGIGVGALVRFIKLILGVNR